MRRGRRGWRRRRLCWRTRERGARGGRRAANAGRAGGGRAAAAAGRRWRRRRRRPRASAGAGGMLFRARRRSGLAAGAARLVACMPGAAAASASASLRPVELGLCVRFWRAWMSEVGRRNGRGRRLAVCARAPTERERNLRAMTLRACECVAVKDQSKDCDSVTACGVAFDATPTFWAARTSRGGGGTTRESARGALKQRLISCAQKRNKPHSHIQHPSS